jgi:hypothetical protein
MLQRPLQSSSDGGCKQYYDATVVELRSKAHFSIQVLKLRYNAVYF